MFNVVCVVTLYCEGFSVSVWLLDEDIAVKLGDSLMEDYIPRYKLDQV